MSSSKGAAGGGVKGRRKSRAGAVRRRHALLDAAARAIARHGYHGMSLRELARETGQSLANFYNHFPSKSAVLLRIQVDTFQALLSATEAAMAKARTAQERLFALFLENLGYLAEHPEVMRVLVHEAGTLAPPDRAQVRALKQRYFELGRRVVEELLGRRREAVTAGELERLTYGVFGMMNWAYGWYRPAQHGAPEVLARSLQELALSGLRGAGVRR